MIENPEKDEQKSTNKGHHGDDGCYFWNGMMKPFLKGCVAIIMAVVLIGGGSFLAIKLCLWGVLSAPESKLMEGIMPLLEKLVWPLFIMVLVFLFWKKLEDVLGQVPGLVKRSAGLPGSPPGATEQTTLTTENNLTGAGKSSSGEMEANDEPFDERHEKEIAKIFDTIQREEDIQITRNVSLLGSKWVCNGSYSIGNTTFYITVLPKTYLERVPSIIQRTNEAVEAWNWNHMAQKGRFPFMPILMICIYGFKEKSEIDKVEAAEYRGLANHKVAFRFFLKEQLVEKGSE